MSDDAQDGSGVDITTYEKQELLVKVIGKHKRLLDEYMSELDGIKSKVESLNSAINSSRQKKELRESKIDILTEKRQLFYHQAEKQLDELKADSGSDPTFQKGLRDVSEELAKAKTSLPPEEEKKLTDSIIGDLSSLASNIPDKKDAMDSIIVRVNDAIASSMELSSIKNSDEDLDKEKADSEKELEELSPRHKWLENRISSHTEALKYWETLSSGQQDEVKA